VIEDYFRQVGALITDCRTVQAFSVTYDKRSSYVGFIRGSIYLLDGSFLHFREFVNVQHVVERYMYAYHYQRPDGTLVFRYDNTPHFPALTTFPHHKHVGGELSVVPATPPDLPAVLAEIQSLIAASML
jgi:hypothetical protein